VGTFGLPRPPSRRKAGRRGGGRRPARVPRGRAQPREWRAVAARRPTRGPRATCRLYPVQRAGGATVLLSRSPSGPRPRLPQAERESGLRLPWGARRRRVGAGRGRAGRVVGGWGELAEWAKRVGGQGATGQSVERALTAGGGPAGNTESGALGPKGLSALGRLATRERGVLPDSQAGTPLVGSTPGVPWAAPQGELRAEDRGLQDRSGCRRRPSASREDLHAAHAHGLERVPDASRRSPYVVATSVWDRSV